MRYGFCIAVATAALLAAPAFAGPQSSEFSSQGVTVEVPGVDLHLGPGHERDRHHDRWRERDVRGDRGCKTITVQERGPNGTMITKTRSTC